jgi:hypothetical protein
LRKFSVGLTCNDGFVSAVQNQTLTVFCSLFSLSSIHQAATPHSPWVQVLDTQDMDQHALAQQGWDSCDILLVTGDA